MNSFTIRKLLERENILSIGNRFPTRIMAAINLSSESFYKKSTINFRNEKTLEDKFSKAISEGCEIIDLGPKSTAPVDIYREDTFLSPKIEIERIKIPLKVLRDFFPKVIVSIDTQSAEVAEYSLSHGADLINDISGLKMDNNLAKVIADYNSGVVVMACKISPGDVFKTEEVTLALSESKDLALDAGISEKCIIFDPGIGGWVPERTPEDDFKLIIDTPKIKKELGLPSLIALSRKSFIGKTLDIPPSERLAGSLSATAISTIFGADIIRTHDILETKHAIVIAEELQKYISKIPAD